MTARARPPRPAKAATPKLTAEGVMEVLRMGGNMLRIVHEDHPAWKGMNPRAWQEKTDYFEWKFAPAFEAFRTQRAELLKVLEPLPAASWSRTATVSAPPGRVYEYSVLYYGDWMARHEQSHLKHMGKILKELISGS